MIKTTKKAKEPVTIRYKALQNGNQSIYLDIYHDGKRSYKFLKLYLVPETSPQAKIQNKNTMQAANAIKSQMILDITNGVAGISTVSRKASKTKLQDWFVECIDNKRKKGNLADGTIYNYDKVREHLEGYNPDATLKDVDKDFCIGFIKYLDGKIQKSTAKTYFAFFKAILNKAVKDGIIERNPALMLDDDERICPPKRNRDYLEIDELKLLLNSDFRCKSDVKTAFFFSCFCGLRISDIRNLTWGDILTNGEQPKARIVTKKTKEAEYLPLSENAMRYLPDRGDKKDNDFVFYIPALGAVSETMKKWTTPLIPNKHITFHTARHTFATTMLTLGADLYTVSKLLGHTNVSTTQIYAEIIDKKKTDAVNLTNGIF